MKNDDIEILDFDENVFDANKEGKEKKDKKKLLKNKNNNEKKRKYYKGEKVFLIISILFIISCFAFYGYRFYYYYHKTHDIVDSITLKDKLTSLNNITYQGDGLYEKNGYFYYKGQNVNNYIYYSGRLFRIIDINDGIQIIEDNTETNLVWGIDTNFNDSNVNKWLNNYLNTLKDYDLYLMKNKWCNEKIEIDSYNCNEMIEDYVGLLNVNNYLQAGSKNSYLNNQTYFWTINQDMNGSPLYINNEGNINNIYKKEDNYFSYGIRPVIKLKSDLSIISGDGTLNNPFIIEDLGKALLKDNSVGSYVTYYNKNYRILSLDDNGISLIYDGVLDIDKKYDDVSKYLNNEFIKELNQKDLVKNNYEIYEYSLNSKYMLNDNKKDSIYITIPKIGDLFLNEYSGYWLNNYSDSMLGLYYTIDDNLMIFSDLKNNVHKIRPIIKLNNEMVVSDGIGTKNSPLIIDEEGDINDKEN